MKVEDYYKEMGVVHSDDCDVCDDYKLSYETHTSFLRQLYEKEHTPLVLAILLVLGVYIVVTTKLVEYIVGGL